MHSGYYAGVFAPLQGAAVYSGALRRRGRMVLGKVKVPLHGLPKRVGRMRIKLTLHGGDKALMNVIQGLVHRNERSLREGRVPAPEKALSRVRFTPDPVWRDGVSALVDGEASAGTIAAWKAALERVKGNADAQVVMVGGVPQVVVGVQEGVGKLIDLSTDFGRPPDLRPGVVGSVEPSKGRVNARMILTLDDPNALPIRELGDAIVRHNADQIASEGLPRLYDTDVEYRTEGTPEKWWDAREILIQGHDDCEGLAAYRAGELILGGFDAHVHTRPIRKPGKFVGGRKGSRLFHALTRVDLPGGRKVFDDPSVNMPARGMRVPGWYRKYAASQRRQGKSL